MWWTWYNECKILVELNGLFGFEKWSFYFFGMACMCLRVQECERLGEKEMEVWNKWGSGIEYLLKGSTSLSPSLFNVCSSISIFMSVSKYMNKSIWTEQLLCLAKKKLFYLCLVNKTFFAIKKKMKKVYETFWVFGIFYLFLLVYNHVFLVFIYQNIRSCLFWIMV